MDDNVMSLESIYATGTGLSRQNIHSYSSEERFDGDFDNLAKEVASAESYVNFANIYQDLALQNSNERIRMLRKLRAHTAGIKESQYSRSVEDYIERSMEDAETAAAENGGKEPAGNPGGNLEKKQGFLAKAWEVVKRFFENVYKWISKKIKAFIGWIQGKANSGEISEIQNLPPEGIEALAGALKTYWFEDQSEDGSIPLTNNAAFNFSNNIKVYIQLCKHMRQVVDEVASTGNKFEGLNTDLSAIKSALSQLPGVGEVPMISDIKSEEAVKEYNKKLKTLAQHLTFNHDPVGYTKYFAGVQLLEGKDKLSVQEYFGTNDPKAIIELSQKSSESLKEAQKKIDEVTADVRRASDRFSKFLRDNKFASGSGDNTAFNQYKDSEKDESKKEENHSNAKLMYEYCTIVHSIFNIIAKMESIISRICAKLINSSSKGITLMLKLKKEVIQNKEEESGFFGNWKTRKEKREFNKLAKEAGRKGSRFDASQTSIFGNIGRTIGKIRAAPKNTADRIENAITQANIQENIGNNDAHDTSRAKNAQWIREKNDDF